MNRREDSWVSKERLAAPEIRATRGKVNVETANRRLATEVLREKGEPYAGRAVSEMYPEDVVKVVGNDYLLKGSDSDSGRGR